MDDTYRCLVLLHVLTTRAAGSEVVDLDVLILDHDVDVILNIGDNFDQREGGVTALVGVEGADPNFR
ncbi:MAG: hypothetical protein U0528_14940 [Anaerolineae bacterium]